MGWAGFGGKHASFTIRSGVLTIFAHMKPRLLRVGTQLLLVLLLFAASFAGPGGEHAILPAAATPSAYMPALKNKRVAVVVNQTSEVNGVLLPDALMAAGISVKKIFVPEHGFRGREEAGAHIANTTDSATGLPVISLYGKNKKPQPDQLEDVDILVYDLQDVGTRFYTYISTMEYCMQACAAAGKGFMVLDRPNPNGFYVDGPVLEPQNRSFVGMQAIPVVYGMTAGEYAMMLKGERWFDGAEKLDLRVIKCTNYDHSKKYRLPVAPSPNLRTMEAVYAYPSLCLFEGTVISMGRGTEKPFRQYGCPEFEGKYDYSFVPSGMQGALHPPYEGRRCYGELVAGSESQILSSIDGRFRLNWLIRAYNSFPDKSKFFTGFFKSLAGTDRLEQQIKSGANEEDIRKSWTSYIEAFMKIRKKYLLYPDFGK